MGLYGAYATDPVMENEGAWVEMREGARFQIRSDVSKRVKDWALKRAKSQRQLIIAHEGMLPGKISDQNEIDLCAEAVVAGWENVTGPDGKPVAYSEENARKLFKDLPILRQNILLVSRTEATYRAEVEALGKTSAPSSEPSSSSGPTPAP